MSEEQQKLPNLLLHVIFRIDEIAAIGPHVHGPYCRDSLSSVFPRPQIAFDSITRNALASGFRKEFEFHHRTAVPFRLKSLKVS